MSKRVKSIPPSEDVVHAFGAAGSPQLLDGGQGQTFRVGDAVLKPLSDKPMTHWVAQVMSTLEEDGFRVARPRRARTGGWLYSGWGAWDYIDGAICIGRWADEVASCLRFHAAISGVEKPKYFHEDVSPWTIADEATWGDRALDLHPRIAEPVDRLRSLLRPVSARAQLIHGDFGGSNLLYHETLPPAVLDMSSFWRPVGIAVGVLIADAIVWEGAGYDVIDLGKDIDDFTQLLIRAELRRIIELQTVEEMLGWPMLQEIDNHLPLVDYLCQLES
ncbi:MAG: phosphotransferase [Candidatus Latescibacteria bacterium]|nr:phosphotransferase [Candidatus Latescibacterota bacterium]